MTQLCGMKLVVVDKPNQTERKKTHDEIHVTHNRIKFKNKHTLQVENVMITQGGKSNISDDFFCKIVSPFSYFGSLYYSGIFGNMDRESNSQNLSFFCW